MATNKTAVAETIRNARGILKRQRDEKSFAERWAEHKREEKELEEAKFQRLRRIMR